MSYYLLDCPLLDDGAVISTEPDLPTPLNLWNRGQRFTVPVPEPLLFFIEEEDEGEMLPLFNTGSHLLMTTDLVAALQEAGVDNIDVYDAHIETESGQKHTDYKAVNVIGLVRAADMYKSEGEDIGLIKDGLRTTFFTKLVLDEEKAKGFLLFRLAERLSSVFVHVTVKTILRAKGFDRLTFSGPDEV